MTDTTDYVPLKRAAAQADVSISTIRNWIRAGFLPAYRRQGEHRLLVRSSEVDAHLTAAPVEVVQIRRPTS